MKLNIIVNWHVTFDFRIFKMAAIAMETAEM